NYLDATVGHNRVAKCARDAAQPSAGRDRGRAPSWVSPDRGAAMFYHRPKMSAIFYPLGVLGILTATIGFLLAVATYFEQQGVSKNDVKVAFIASLSMGLGSLLTLGLASILNVLHAIRAEAARLAAMTQAAGQQPLAAAMARAAEHTRLTEHARLAEHA